MTAVSDPRRRAACGSAGRWAATALIVVGAGLIVRGPADELSGQWRQHQLAASTDIAVSRYRNAVVAAYDSVSTDPEARLVSFEFGAVPTTADGRLLLSSAEPTAPQSTGAHPGSGGRPSVLADDAARPGVYISQQAAAPAGDLTPRAPTPTEREEFTGAIIHIPKVGVSQAVVSGVSREHLKAGPGHYPGTALPGHAGNVVISGHRTTYTRPFIDLDVLVAGDEVVVDTREGSFRYLVESSHVVAPDDAGLLRASGRSLLTLTTCTPKGTADQRLIVIAVLDGDPVGQS